MPEQITKYPDITLEVLQGAGAVCGKGAPQKILKQCPAERFCSLPTGEIIIAVALGSHGLGAAQLFKSLKPFKSAEGGSPRPKSAIDARCETQVSRHRVTW